VASSMSAYPGPLALEVIANFDHGYFAGHNPKVDAFDNRAAANRRTERWVVAAVDAYLRGGAAMPAMPRLTDDGATFRAEVDSSRRVRQATLWYSTDGAYTLASRAMLPAAEGGVYEAELQLGAEARSRLAAYVEVEYAGGPFISSLPQFGPSFVQRMRPFPG
jgi:hypothetical protein